MRAEALSRAEREVTAQLSSVAQEELVLQEKGDRVRIAEADLRSQLESFSRASEALAK